VREKPEREESEDSEVRKREEREKRERIHSYTYVYTYMHIYVYVYPFTYIHMHIGSDGDQGAHDASTKEPGTRYLTSADIHIHVCTREHTHMYWREIAPFQSLYFQSFYTFIFFVVPSYDSTYSFFSFGGGQCSAKVERTFINFIRKVLTRGLGRKALPGPVPCPPHC
jgi:hypothetical protein